MNDDRLKRLEEKIAFLERHVTEQDKAMLELREEVGRLRRGLKKVRQDTVEGGAPGAERGETDSADERPPHY